MVRITGLLHLLICLLACCQRVKNKIILPLDNATNRLTCEEWGNPYLRVLRSQLEKYIAEEFGEDYLLRVKNQTELCRVKKEISDLKKRLEGLQERKHELEALLGK